AERVETIVSAMLADPEVRLPGARRFACEKTARSRGIEIPDDMLAQVEKLCLTQTRSGGCRRRKEQSERTTARRLLRRALAGRRTTAAQPSLQTDTSR